MEALMDEYLTASNTNISFEMEFNSERRVVRSTIDFMSGLETAKKLLPFILEDLCEMHTIPLKVSSEMNLIIEDIERTVREIYKDNKITIEEKQTIA